MESPRYALLLERLIETSERHDWREFERLLPEVQRAHLAYNQERLDQGKRCVVLYPASWDGLSREAHRLVLN